MASGFLTMKKKGSLKGFTGVVTKPHVAPKVLALVCTLPGTLLRTIKEKFLLPITNLQAAFSMLNYQWYSTISILACLLFFSCRNDRSPDGAVNGRNAVDSGQEYARRFV